MAIPSFLQGQGYTEDIYGNLIAPSRNALAPAAAPGVSTSVTPGTFIQPGRSAFDLSPGYQQTPNIHKQTYTSDGATFSRTGQSYGLNPTEPSSYGAWQDPTGTQISDLPAYLQMREQQKQGANFGAYQNALTNALQSAERQKRNYQALLETPTAIQFTPEYQYAFNQGRQAIERSAAAKGMLNSGNVLAELAKFGQGIATQNYQRQLTNQQQAFEEQMQQVNALANLMRGSQEFGLRSGYYENPEGLTWYGGQRILPNSGGGYSSGITSTI